MTVAMLAHSYLKHASTLHEAIDGIRRRAAHQYFAV